MSIEQRIQYLLRAAARAEAEGHLRVADALRRMAEDSRPFGPRSGFVSGA